MRWIGEEKPLFEKHVCAVYGLDRRGDWLCTLEGWFAVITLVGEHCRSEAYADSLHKSLSVVLEGL